jgi:hypothetical protein
MDEMAECGMPTVDPAKPAEAKGANKAATTGWGGGLRNRLAGLHAEQEGGALPMA